MGPGGPDCPNPLPAGALALSFDGVSFSLTGQRRAGTPLVLHDLSFALQPGSVLGLLGRTGSGKTTLTRLVFRLYDPTAGQIRLGGQNVARIHAAGAAPAHRHRHPGGAAVPRQRARQPDLLRPQPSPTSASAPCWKSWSWATGTAPCPGAGYAAEHRRAQPFGRRSPAAGLRARSSCATRAW